DRGWKIPNLQKNRKIQGSDQLARVPDAVQRVTKWSHKRVYARLRRAMAADPGPPQTETVHASRVLPHLRTFHRRSGKPEIGVCSAPQRNQVYADCVNFCVAALRPGHKSAATQHLCATAWRAKHQPVGVGNERRLGFPVSGLLFTENAATATCRAFQRP